MPQFPIRQALLVAATLSISSISPQPAFAHDKVMEVAHTAYTAGDQNIRAALLALDISGNSIVTSYAQRMVDDHRKVNKDTDDILHKLNMKMENNQRSREISSGAKKTRGKLRKLASAQFDCAYALNEMKYHGMMNRTIAKHVLPNLSIEPLNVLFSDALVKFKVHWGHAELMVKTLKCKK